MKTFYVYLLASKKNGTLYCGVTNDIYRRVLEHKNKAKSGFISKYAVNKLMWYESTDNIEDAIQREKQIKKWCRQWKINLIEQDNPN